MDYFEKMQQALSLIGDQEPIVEQLYKARDIFKEIHDHVQDVPLFTGSVDRYNEYAEEMKKDHPDLAIRIKAAWNFFLSNVCNAPTSVHLTGCVILQIPYIYSLMMELENNKS